MVDALLMALGGVNIKPGGEPDDMISIGLWMKPSRIITARRYKLLSIQAIVNQLKSNRGLTNSAASVVAFQVILFRRKKWF